MLKVKNIVIDFKVTKVSMMADLIYLDMYQNRKCDTFEICSTFPRSLTIYLSEKERCQ